MTDLNGWSDDAVNAAEDAVLGSGQQWRQSVDRVLAALAPFVAARISAAVDRAITLDREIRRRG
jgi:hypothetical protein